MFQSLRAGAPFYVLYKNEPKIAIGNVEFVSEAIPQFSTNYVNGIASQPKSVVDVKVRMDEEVINLQKLPADAVIADFGTMVVSESRESMSNEIEALKAISEKVLKDVDKHRHCIDEYDKMLSLLNPRIAKEAEQAKEIDSLRRDLDDIKALLSKALEHGSKSKEEK